MAGKRLSKIMLLLLVFAALLFCAPAALADESATYGDPVPASLAGASWTSAAPNMSRPGAGVYPYTLADGTSGTLTVRPMPVTVTADAQAKAQGDRDPEWTYSVSPALLTGDSFSGKLNRESGETPGAYRITQGTLANPNYNIQFVGNMLTITASSSGRRQVPVHVRYDGSFSSSRKIPDACYGETVGADVVAIDLYQEEESGSTELRFRTAYPGRPSASVTMYVALPSHFSTSKDYYVRRDTGGSDVRLSADIERYGGDYYLVFATSVLDDATFKVIRKSSSSKDDDGRYRVSSFWENVIDGIDDARAGERVRVNAGTRSTVPAEVLRALRGRDVTLLLRRSNGTGIEIYGKDVEKIPSSRDSYTMSTLAKRYRVVRADDPASSAPPASSSAPQVVYKPVYVPVPTPASSQASSSAASAPDPPSSSEEEGEVLEPSRREPPPESGEGDFEVPAEEEPSEEALARAGSDPALFGVFVLCAVLLAAILAVLLTILACLGRKKGS